MVQCFDRLAPDDPLRRQHVLEQRRGLGVSAPTPLYVLRIEPKTRRVVVGPGSSLPERGLVVEDRPKPEPGPGEALVKVAACGLCHTDLHYLDHGVPTAAQPPIILGHEPSGVVESLGAGATAVAEGQRVLVPAVISCGVCETCLRGRANLCPKMEMFGNHRDGAFAEYVTCPAHELVPLPDDFPLEEAALLSDGVTTDDVIKRLLGDVSADSEVRSSTKVPAHAS